MQGDFSQRLITRFLGIASVDFHGLTLRDHRFRTAASIPIRMASEKSFGLLG
jgi:hypothetical protein